jgi:hypothetical protein
MSEATHHPAAGILVVIPAITLGCGGHGASASSIPDGSSGGGVTNGSSGGDSGDLIDAAASLDGAPSADTGSSSPSDGAASVDGSHLACVPAIPSVAWTSPYAAWSRGIPTAPTFFPIGVWLQIPQHATALAKLGINIYIGNNAGTDTLAAGDLTMLKSLGMYAIIGQDSAGLPNIADTTIIGWWMDPDEPDNAQPASSGGYGPPVDPTNTLVPRYNSYKAADATRPIYLGLGQGVAYANYEGRGSNPPAESLYVPASDIVAFDIYPYNNCSGDTNEKVTCGEFWLNASGVDNLHQWAKSSRNQAVWTDFETTVINAGTTAGPTPVQTVSEVWLALIHSANGIIYFIDSWNPTFSEDAILQDSAMVTAVTALNKQIIALAPELNSATLPNMVTVTTAGDAGAPVDTMVKANGTSLYVFSAIARPGSATATFAINGMTGNGAANVVGENRSIPIGAGMFADAFAANGAHIYQIDLSKAVCN